MIWPHGSVVLGRRLARFIAAGLKSAGLIRLFTYGARKVTCRPPLHCRRRERREIARQHRRRRHERDVRRRTPANRRALIRAEEEQPVPQDRTAQRAAELVPLEAVVIPLAVGADRRERARGVEPMVAEELEGIPREPVGARLGHGVDRRRRLEAVLRGEAARRDAELLERVRETAAGGSRSPAGCCASRRRACTRRRSRARRPPRSSRRPACTRAVAGPVCTAAPESTSRSVT